MGITLELTCFPAVRRHVSPQKQDSIITLALLALALSCKGQIPGLYEVPAFPSSHLWTSRGVGHTCSQTGPALPSGSMTILLLQLWLLPWVLLHLLAPLSPRHGATPTGVTPCTALGQCQHLRKAPKTYTSTSPQGTQTVRVSTK